MYFNYVSPYYVPSVAPHLCCGPVTFHSVPNCRKEVLCSAHSCSTLLNNCFKSCTTAHLQLLPCLCAWVSFGKEKKPGHVEELSVDWSPPTTQLQHVQSTSVTRSTPQTILYYSCNLQQKVP